MFEARPISRASIYYREMMPRRHCQLARATLLTLNRVCDATDHFSHDLEKLPAASSSLGASPRAPHPVAAESSGLKQFVQTSPERMAKKFNLAQ
jgi:hypothetical protein